MSTRTTADDTELVRRYLNAFNERDLDTMAELLAEDVVEHGIHEDLHGFEETRAFRETHFETFPDYAGTTDDMVAEDDTVAVRYTVSGTHTGEYWDVEPTGHEATRTG